MTVHQACVLQHGKWFDVVCFCDYTQRYATAAEARHGVREHALLTQEPSAREWRELRPAWEDA